MDSAAMAKKLRCYLGLHQYQRLQNEEGEPFKQCRDCEKFLDQQVFTVTMRRGKRS